MGRLLLEHRADATVQQKDGWTPLHLASNAGYEDIARLLLEHGTDATAQDENGWAPLHVASEKGHEDIVRFLLEHGVESGLVCARYDRKSFPVARW